MTTEILRLFLLLTLFTIVFLVAQMILRNAERSRSHVSAINKRLKMIRSGAEREEVFGDLLKNQPREYPTLPKFVADRLIAFQRMIFASAIPFSMSQIALAMAIGAIVIFLMVIAAMAFNSISLSFGAIQLAIIFAVALAVGAPLIILNMMAQQRRKKMEAQFPIALDIFVRALRSGHPIASAIDLLTNEMEDPVGSEFGLVADEVAYGADLTSALHEMAERWDLDDIRMFVVSISVQSETGGNLAEILENISKVIRDRAQMFMKVRALSSEGRMTGWMLTGLPVMAFLLIFSAQPQFYLNVVEDSIFIYGSIFLLGLYSLGVYIIRKMVDIKV